MNYKTALMAACFFGGFNINFAGAQPTQDPPAAAAHVRKASEIGGKDLAQPAKMLCFGSRTVIAMMSADAAAHPPEEPAKVFDNLYFVGGRSVTSWAIKTSAGIILIDAMNNDQDAKDYIEAGMKKVGLNPADIKYILISHGHGDHFGGAKYLQDKYGAHVLMSPADWAFMAQEAANPRARPPGLPPQVAPPRHDMDAADGQKLTLGDTTIILALTPGHTPGTLSFIIPVTDRGRPHMVALWGGTGQPSAGPASEQYEASIKHFGQMTSAAHVDAEISNHPLPDGGIDRLDMLRANPNGPNPFVIGEANYKRYLNILNECLLAARERPAEARGAAGPGRPGNAPR